ncbi:hypothetical protein [Hymenobacter lucidus]|uniref:Tetratricopeptide repeat protein n=1 Tax=Hymenobacter lucidus TaxID=2880930 RepID=A0ABS8AYH7_9BACT|nr:hypothetical protein [Hymenobacter lucidus]MCB2410851.1 hypothetical protein [Hymenobacter lucidus]
MTRASLLQIIDHVSVISDSEIRELEQLAAAFPYCQTAHVLLAKAAHDQGSMLASQRLRRAATYAADRQLLRQLIEEPAPVSAATIGFEPVTYTQPLSATEPEVEIQSEPTLPEATDLAVVEETTPLPVTNEPEATDLTPEETIALAVTTEPEATPETVSVTEPDFAVTESADVPATDVPVTDAPPLETADAEIADTVLVETPVADTVEHLDEPLVAEPHATEATADSEQSAPFAVAADLVPEEVAADNSSTLAREPEETENTTPEPEATIEEPVETEAGQLLAEAPEHSAEFTEEDAEPEATTQKAEVPLESGAGSIAENQEVTAELSASVDAAETPELTAVAADSLLGDIDILPAVAPPIRPPVEVGSSRFEFGLGLPEPGGAGAYELPTLLEEEAEATVEPATVTAGFRGDEHMGYALGGGSRLGFCLQLADDLTQPLPATEFFAPDALLHAQTPHYLPPPPPAPSPFDLINKFLRNQPRLRTPAALPVSAEEQADLSVRSTQGVPDIASESLAKIMVRQGKLQKAIEIYERLIVRQPEKKAYFAEQIQQLKSTE